MLKREITYEDFNGDTVTDTFYFNLSKAELIEMEVEYEHGGFAKFLQRIIDTKDNKELVKQFKEIILMSYGQKSDDGKRFIKSDVMRDEFVQSAAYTELFMELSSDDQAAVIFLSGILPKDMVVAMNKELEEKKTAEPGTTTSSPPSPPAPAPTS
jgi:hypothetical protein